MVKVAERIELEKEVLLSERVYGYAIVMPSDEDLKASWEGIEREINRLKEKLKRMPSWSKLWQAQDVARLRSNIRKLQEIQLEIDAIRKWT